MNEGSGQVVRDWSGNRNNGYLGTSPAADASDPTWVDGVFNGSALHFDGNDNVTIPAADSLRPLRRGQLRQPDAGRLPDRRHHG